MDRRFADLETRVTNLSNALAKLEQSLAIASKRRGQLAADVAAIKAFLPILQRDLTRFAAQLTTHTEHLQVHDQRLTKVEESLASYRNSMERFTAWVSTLPVSQRQ